MPDKKDLAELGLQEVHCTTCGVFLGYVLLNDGIAGYFCRKKHCKNFTVFSSNQDLTDDELNGNMKART